MEVTGPTFSYTPLAWALKFPILKTLSIKVFNYEANPLAIRLLKLLPSSDFNSGIHVEVSHTVLESSQSYEALSYVWGDPTDVTPIRVNARRHYVTVNLELALRYLRSENEEMVLWIDALCIKYVPSHLDIPNQNAQKVPSIILTRNAHSQQDLEEKNYQVQRMREIYLKAKRVIVWLGEERTAQLALDFCHRKERVAVPQGDARINSSPEIDACLDLFVARPWWNRIWTVQEVYTVSPVEFRIGKLNVEFSVMREYYRYFYMSVIWDGTPHAKASYLKLFRIGCLPQPVAWGRQELVYEEKLGKEKLGQPLLSLLQKTRGMQASDPRDKIFALHGLVREKEVITVDYTASKHNVFINVTRALLETNWDMLEDILLSVESVDRDPQLPSWVPDFSSRQRAIPLVMRY